MRGTFWKGEPVENMHRDVLVEILRQQHFRIAELEAALKEAGEMWVRKDNRIEVLETALREARQKFTDVLLRKGYDPTLGATRDALEAFDTALAPEQDK